MRARLGLFTPGAKALCYGCHGPVIEGKEIRNFGVLIRKRRYVEDAWACDQCGQPTTDEDRSDVNKLAALRMWLPGFKLCQTGGMNIGLRRGSLIIIVSDDDDDRYNVSREMPDNKYVSYGDSDLGRNELIQLCCKLNTLVRIRVEIDREYSFTQEEWDKMCEAACSKVPSLVMSHVFNARSACDSLFDSMTVTRCENS